MGQIQLNIPSKEFVESNFNKIFNELASLKNQLKPSNDSTTKYYRNKELKRIFGLSENTIDQYRDKGILPFTKLGNIHYYPVQEINRILDNNASYGKQSLLLSNTKVECNA